MCHAHEDLWTVEICKSIFPTSFERAAQLIRDRGERRGDGSAKFTKALGRRPKPVRHNQWLAK
jgi:hypothetical protein